jgi:hypothetical protein
MTITEELIASIYNKCESAEKSGGAEVKFTIKEVMEFLDELVDLKDDADRFRWLVEDPNREDMPDGYVWCVEKSEDGICHAGYGDDLVDAIDCAMDAAHTRGQFK